MSEQPFNNASIPNNIVLKIETLDDIRNSGSKAQWDHALSNLGATIKQELTRRQHLSFERGYKVAQDVATFVNIPLNVDSIVEQMKICCYQEYMHLIARRLIDHYIMAGNEPDICRDVINNAYKLVRPSSIDNSSDYGE